MEEKNESLLTLESDPLLQVIEALPDQFEFYHLGGVELQSPASDENAAREKLLALDLAENHVIGFTIQGDIKLHLLLFFDKALDKSTYSELGNVIASKIVTHLTQNQEMDLLLSPPQNMAESQIHRIAQSNMQMLCRTYAHFFQNSVISIEAMIIPGSAEGTGNA
jgi:hypothetical protein